MKRSSEGELGEALRGLDLEPYVFRIPDPKTGAGVANWKPCDFLVWWTYDPAADVPATVRSAWVEAKDVDAVNWFPRSALRPSQLAGIREAGRLGVPYLLCVYWRRAKRWTISDAVRVLAWLEGRDPADAQIKSVPRKLLMSRFGVDAAPRDLGQTIKVILEDGW